MNYDNIFLVRDGSIGGTLHLKAMNLPGDPYDIHAGVTRPVYPIIYKQHSGRYLHDQLTTTHAILVLYSERVISMLADRKFTGWITYPVEIYRKDGRSIPGYYGFSVIGRCGPIDDGRRQRVLLPPREKGGKCVQGLRGLKFQGDSWDGSDIFCPLGTGFIFITEEVRRSLQEIKPSNVSFLKLSDFEVIDASGLVS